ncbi:MAG: glycosyltransferase [Bacteroidia bacterium]|nr:glycosyltransferase [Bacteroidia bacterium]MCF8425932.1 glycosyltransferase [Bacteroidia bacterium]MCF8446305.1 glycosyltransferase [Bacteroidia bacterium]
MNIYIDIFLWVVFAILVFNVAYMTLYAIAGLFYGKEHFPIIENKLRFAIFIPAYKGDEVIIHTATETLKQAYPKEAFDVIVIADSLREESVAILKSLPLIVVEVKFENSTKGKSINAAIQEVAHNHYDYAVILDIDNIVEERFLEKMNSALQKDQLVLQAHRLAKNEDTGFSILDGISEEINNHIFRKGHKVLGISAALIGSGKAIKYPFFVEIMKDINAIGGFDKQMEILIISKKIIIDYAHEILVYDEKVQKSEVFQNQRKRWMSAQFTYMKKYALKGIWTSITTFNLDYLDKSIQLVLLPRLINLGMSIIFCLVWFTPSVLGNWFVIILVIQIFALLLATPIKYYNKNTLKALLNLPYGFLLMFLNFFKLRGANKKFIHTPHSVSENTNSKGSS